LFSVDRFKNPNRPEVTERETSGALLHLSNLAKNVTDMHEWMKQYFQKNVAQRQEEWFTYETGGVGRIAMGSGIIYNLHNPGANAITLVTLSDDMQSFHLSMGLAAGAFVGGLRIRFRENLNIQVWTVAGPCSLVIAGRTYIGGKVSDA
jgi:hypothetical protein